MAIIKIDGSTLTSHQGASDITDVVNTSQITEGSNLYYTEARVNANFATKTTTDLTEGSNLYYTTTRFNNDYATKTTTDLTEGTNLYFTDVRAVDAVEATSLLTLDSLRVDKGTSATSTQSAFANAAIQAVSTTNGVPIYSLRSTSNTSFEPAKWGTGLFELQFDADLTGVDLDGTSQTIAFNIGDSNGSHNVAGLDTKIVDTVIDGNGDIESFNAEIEFRVNDKVNGGNNQSFPLRLSSSKIAINTSVESFNNGFTVGGNYDSLIDQIRIETNSSRWNRSRSAMRATANADFDSGAGLEQFNNEFGVDTSYSLNNSEIANIGVQVEDPDFNGDNTLGYGNGQSAFFNVQLRGDGYVPGSGPPLQALKIEPWSSRLTMNTASGTANLTIETNAPAIEDTKPHVFVNLTTTERNALTAESGMMIFNTTDVKLQCYDGSAWNNLH